MANRCPNCGGTLQFDVKSQKLICPFCGSSFEPSEIDNLQGAQEMTSPETHEPGEPTYDETAETQDTTVFTCKNCGGEITSESMDAVSYCPYCGTFATFESRIEKLRKPELITPFLIPKDVAEGYYKKRLKRQFFAPSDLKKEGKGTNFNPMFIPFWDYEVTYPFTNHYITSESWREGNYDCKQEYYVAFDAEGGVKNCLYDASMGLDDRIADSMADYDARGLQPYNPSYMMGAYADMADVDPKLYSSDAKERADEPLTQALKNEIINSGAGTRFMNAKGLSFSGQSGTKAYVKPHLAMLPAWFMTYRTKDRVAYSVINAQTGSVFSEVPVSIAKYLIFSLILAVPIFLLFELFVNARPTQMLGVVGVITSIVMIMYAVSASKEAAINKRAGDKGFGGPAKKKAPKPQAAKKDIGSTIFTIIMVFIFIATMFKGAIGSLNGFPIRVIFVLIAVIALMIGFAKADGKGAYIRDTMGGIIAMGLSVLFFFYDPVDDNYYYIAAIIAMIGMILSVIGAVSRFNKRVSHPLPHFFDQRKGATM